MAETASTGRVEEGLPRRRTVSAEEVLRRRIRNRDCMRRKRQDPAYRAFERRRREWRDLEPEQYRFFEGPTTVPTVGRKSKQRCSICRQREAVEIITRLRPCAEVRGGYVQMRIAYCGLC